jgi:hypothetical protein
VVVRRHVGLAGRRHSSHLLKAGIWILELREAGEMDRAARSLGGIRPAGADQPVGHGRNFVFVGAFQLHLSAPNLGKKAIDRTVRSTYVYASLLSTIF